MRLTPGQTAPDFVAKDIDGNDVRLADHAGRRVWLAFFRYAACPLCSFRIHELLAKWEEQFAKHDFELLTVWQSKAEKLEEVRERYDPPFTIVSDPDMELFKLYRVESKLGGVFGKEVIEGIKGARKIGLSVVRKWEGPATRIPADFLVEANGTIHTAFYGENVAQQIPFEDVLEFLDKTPPAA